MRSLTTSTFRSTLSSVSAYLSLYSSPDQIAQPIRCSVTSTAILHGSLNNLFGIFKQLVVKLQIFSVEFKFVVVLEKTRLPVTELYACIYVEMLSYTRFADISGCMHAGGGAPAILCTLSVCMGFRECFPPV